MLVDVKRDMCTRKARILSELVDLFFFFPGREGSSALMLVVLGLSTLI